MTSTRGHALAFVALYVAIGLGGFLLMHDRGFHPTDDGFVLAYAWRVAQGEVPYRDFVFERTPLTPYLHSVWLALPEGWAVQAGRLAFYIEMAASALLPTLWAVTRGLRANVLTLAIAGGTFLISLHNFPPMPWMTVDGVLFASAGVTAALLWHDGRSSRWLALSTALLFLAALAKQSFAPLLAFVVVLAVIAGARRRDARTLVAAVVVPAVLGVAFLAALYASDALTPFVQQLSQPSQMRPTATNPWSGDLVAIALKPFLVALSPGLAPLLALIALAAAARDTSARASAYLAPLVLGALVLAAVLMPTDAYNSGFVVFYGVAAIALAEVVRVRASRPRPVPLLAYALVLITGWCAALSFAYQSPILAMGMAAAVVAPVLPPVGTRIERSVAVAALVVIVATSVLINIELPYRDVPREAQTADLVTIYPRLGHLYTNPINAARHRELHDLVQRYALDRGRQFVVFTAFPLAHFLTATRNPLSVDWLEEQEYWGNTDRLRAELERSAPVMVIQRQIGETVAQGQPPLSCVDAARTAPAFASGLLARSALMSEGTYFCVYAP